MNQLISQLMTEVIVEQPRLHQSVKKTYNDFSSSFGDLAKRGWAAVHYTAEHWSTF